MDQAIANFEHDEPPPALYPHPASDRSGEILELFEDCFRSASHQEMDPGEKDGLFLHQYRNVGADYDISREESSSNAQHDEHLFPMSFSESGQSIHSILTQDQGDGSSGFSTPSELFSFSPPHEPRNCDEHTTGAGASYDTTLTTPSPGSRTSASRAKGKDRALGPSTRVSGVPQLPSLDFESEEESDGEMEASTSKPKRVIGWNPELFAPGESGTSLRPGAIISSSPSPDSVYTDDRPVPTSSGLSRAFSQQRFELPRVMQIVVPAEASTSRSLSSFFLPSLSDTLPPPISGLPQPRANSLREMSKNIKIKLKRSREFLRKGKHRDDIESGISTPVLAPSVASGPPFIGARTIQFVSAPDEGGVDQKLKLKSRRSYSSPLPLNGRPSSPHPSSTSSILANPPYDTYKPPCDDEAPATREANDAQEKYDQFNTVLPVEIRLYIFVCLVMSFLNDLSRMVQTNSWSVATAAKLRWVGWEAGIRELVKISRVSVIPLLYFDPLTSMGQSGLPYMAVSCARRPALVHFGRITEFPTESPIQDQPDCGTFRDLATARRDVYAWF